jgi:hypothetical protein
VGDALDGALAVVAVRCRLDRGSGAGPGRRALHSLPLVAAEFAAGRLSYSKVRAVSRVATPETEATLVGWALHATAAQLDRLVAGQRRVMRAADVRARHDARRLSWRWDEDGSLVGSFRLPPEQAAILLQALEVAKESLPTAEPIIADASAEASPAPEAIWAASEPGWQFDRELVDALPPGTPTKPRRRLPSTTAVSPRSVDALVQIATDYLDGKRDATSPSQRERYELVLHATTEQLARDHDDAPDGLATDSGIRLHPETVRRLACDCPTSTLTTDEHGNPLHLGRRTRRIRGRLARALRYRDHGRCQAPGCTNAATITHHIRHWARGGPTCLTNLISLCDAHHWLVHDGGWRIAVTRPGEWRFYTPDGRRLDTDHTTQVASLAAPDRPDRRPRRRHRPLERRIGRRPLRRKRSQPAVSTTDKPERTARG